MGPRGASTLIVRSWLFWAASRYRAPESTCSDQSRKKRTAKTAIATMPSTPTRSASPGVRRYGALTPGSGGRKRGEVLRRSPYGASDKQLDLPRPFYALVVPTSRRTSPKTG